MIGRWLVGTGVFLALLGCAVLGNVAPTMEDQYVVTVQDAAVTFTVSASDEDIDPSNPDFHPLHFVILEGPTHGVLIGDLTQVQVVGPHDALVELTYVPANGFVGIDYVTITVIDPFDETAVGTTTIQIDVERRRMTGLLSGSWTTALTFDVQSSALTAFRSQLTEVYRIGQLVVKGIALWKYDANNPGSLVFDSLRFQVDTPIGDLVRISSTLAFDPNGDPLFDYLRTRTSFRVFDTSFTHTAYLDNVSTNSYQTLVVRGGVGDVSYSNTVTFAMVEDCGYCFSYENLSLAWKWCDLRMRSTVSFTDDGFNSVMLGLSDYPIPGFVRPSFGVYLDLSVTFTPEKKTLTPTLKLKTAWVDCIQILAALETGSAANPVIDGFGIHGIRLQQRLLDGVRVQIALSFDEAKNSSVTGQTDYYELWMISGTTSPCCGAAGTWKIATYFNHDSPMPFDWGMTIIRADVALSDRINVSTETVVRSGFFGDPKLELSLGWSVRW